MLRVDNLVVNYGAICALRGVSFEVSQGQIVALIGSNGAGKTTILRAISGLVKPSKGDIIFQGYSIAGWPPHRIVAAGICHAPEGRMIFANLTVRENLMLGAYRRHDRHQVALDQELVLTTFPKLKERFNQPGGKLSGGEQQMLAIARALLGRPQLLLLDEPSLGIAPILVRTIFAKIQEINAQLGTTVFLVEQNAHMALSIASYAYVLETGQLRLHGPASQIADNPEVRKAYLGET